MQEFRREKYREPIFSVTRETETEYLHINEEKYAQKSKKGIDKCCELCYNKLSVIKLARVHTCIGAYTRA